MEGADKMKKLRKIGILALCIGLAFSGSIVNATDIQDWELPVVGPKLPGGIPAAERQYIVYFKAVDAETGEELSTKGMLAYDWYIPVYLANTPTTNTTRVKISYRLAEWEGDQDGQWFNITDLIEKEVEIANGWNYFFIPLEGVAMEYRIGICKKVEDPDPDENKSDNNYLASLEVERGTMEPSFTKENTEYTLKVDEDVDEMTIHAKTEDETATVYEETVTPLSLGKNWITITVTAENGQKRYYHIDITRGDENSKKEEEENKKQENSGGSSSSRYNTERDLSNFSSVPHIATKISTNGTMIANSGLTVEQTVALLTDEQKEQILTRLKQKIPYTSLGYVLKEAEIKSAVQNMFTDEQISKLLASPELMAQMGINLNEIVTTVELKNSGAVSYSDINDSGDAKVAIEEAISLGVLESTEDGKFYPDSNMKFEDALKLLDNVLLLNNMETMKLGRSTVELYFKNMNIADYPYIGSVASKLQVKTTKDLANKQLGETLTRQEMAQIIYEITEGKLEVNHDDIYISDISDNTYEPALTYAVKAGIISLENESISPNEVLTKGETVQMLMKLNKAIKATKEAEAKAKAEEQKIVATPEEDPLSKVQD